MSLAGLVGVLHDVSDQRAKVDICTRPLCFGGKVSSTCRQHASMTDVVLSILRET